MGFQARYGQIVGGNKVIETKTPEIIIEKRRKNAVNFPAGAYNLVNTINISPKKIPISSIAMNSRSIPSGKTGNGTFS
jgi:hypothetical protein